MDTNEINAVMNARVAQRIGDEVLARIGAESRADLAQRDLERAHAAIEDLKARIPPPPEPAEAPAPA